MASGRWTTPRADTLLRALALAALALAAPSLRAGSCASAPGGPPPKPLYLTFDTGHMAVAPLIAEVLKKYEVKVTFFAANEATRTGNGSLGSDWAGWWQARAAEGHDFASHTYDHSYWRADLPAAPGAAGPRFRVRPSAGPAQAALDSRLCSAQHGAVPGLLDQVGSIFGQQKTFFLCLVRRLADRRHIAFVAAVALLQ